MAILLRLLAAAAIWTFTQYRSANAPPVVRRLQGLSWPRKAQLIWRLSRDKRISPPLRLVVLAPALYMASPIDILPDFVPFLGRIDDAFLFSIAIELLLRLAPASVLAEHFEAVTGVVWPQGTPAR
jgi:uncharacterized membrane protein YkvA (DUF1232 family)